MMMKFSRICLSRKRMMQLQSLSWKKTKTFKKTLIRKLRLSLLNKDGGNGLERVLITQGMSREKLRLKRIGVKRSKS